jgi:hypothetical protein
LRTSAAKSQTSSWEALTTIRPPASGTGEGELGHGSRISRRVGVVPEVKPRAAELLAQLDRFLQWDLVTVTPWGAPSISPVGARVVPDEATIWTSTTVGYAAKLRNIRAQPRVALLRAHPDEPPMLLRGEARIVGGDGTANLAQLFRLM